MSPRMMLIVAAALGALAVSAGAFGAHALKEKLTATGQMNNFETASRYQMYHALALAITGMLALRQPVAALGIAGICFFAGTVIFSGLLYAIALGGPSILGAIVPIGGTALIAGWVLLAVGAWKIAG